MCVLYCYRLRTTSPSGRLWLGPCPSPRFCKGEAWRKSPVPAGAVGKIWGKFESSSASGRVLGGFDSPDHGIETRRGALKTPKSAPRSFTDGARNELTVGMNDFEASTFIAREQTRFERGLCLLLDPGSFLMKAFPAFPACGRSDVFRSLRTCLSARDRDLRGVDPCELELVSLDSRPPQTTQHLDFLTPRSSKGRSLHFWRTYRVFVFLHGGPCRVFVTCDLSCKACYSDLLVCATCFVEAVYSQ